jgi:hypothetical protein
MQIQRMKLITKLFILTLLAPWAFSCANNDLGPVELISCDGVAEVSYLDDIKPIVDANCSRCHNATDFPDRDWTDPAKLKTFASEASRRVQLPVSDPDHMPYDPPELTKQEIQNIVCWAKQGAPIDN